MIKKFEIVKVTRIVDSDGVYYYHDELFIGGYDKHGRFLTVAPSGADKAAESHADRGHTGGVVRPPPPAVVRRQKEHEGEKQISSLQSRLDSAKGEQ